MREYMVVAFNCIYAIIGLSRISQLGKILLLRIIIPDKIIYQQKFRMQLHRKVESTIKERA